MEDVAQYDLTSRIGKFLDRHLLLTVLQFVEAQKIYSAESILKAQLELLSHTNMVDYSITVFASLHKGQEAPAEMKTKRDEVLKTMKLMAADCEPLLQILFNAELMSALGRANSFSLHTLVSEHGVTIANVHSLMAYAKFVFECGNYEEAAQFLGCLPSLLPDDEAKSPQAEAILWGSLAAAILVHDSASATYIMGQVHKQLDASTSLSASESLRRRAWLLHWSLFVAFQSAESMSDAVDHFLQHPMNVRAMTTLAPHLLRYVSAAYVMSNARRKKGGSALHKDLLRLLAESSRSDYCDPVMKLMLMLFVDFDFAERAESLMTECDKLLCHDFFLAPVRENFMQSVRIILFETYCRIYRRVDLATLSRHLAMGPEGTEKWVVDALHGVKVDAKIDTKLNAVVISASAPSSSRPNLVERAKTLSVQSEEAWKGLLQAQSKAEKKDSEEEGSAPAAPAAVAAAPAAPPGKE